MKKIVLLIALLAIPSLALAVPGYPTKCTVKNKTLTSGSTEYPYEIPSGIGSLTIQSRTAADFKLSYKSGESGSVYYTVKSGTVYKEGPVAVSSPNTVLYFNTASAGQVVEIIYCQ